MTSLILDGSAADCRATARDLRRLREALETATDALVSARSTSSNGWSGVAGNAFRTRAGTIIDRADTLENSTRDLAFGLDTLADGLDNVKAQLANARQVVRTAGLPSPAHVLPAPQPDWTPAQVKAHQQAVVLVGQAREVENYLQESWQATLASAAPFTLAPPTRGHRAGRRSPLDSLGDLIPKHRSLPDLIPDLPDLGRLRDKIPDLPDLPDLGPIPPPIIPGIPGSGGTRGKQPKGGFDLPGLSGLKGGPFRHGIDGFIKQFKEDSKRGDVSLLERVGRATLKGALTGGGAVGGAAVCLRAKVPKSIVEHCEKGGAYVGDKSGNWILEKIDD